MKIGENKVSWIYQGQWPRENKITRILSVLQYTERLAEDAETAASKQDMQTLYQLTKTLAGKIQSNDQPIKDQQGNVISKEEEVLKRWKDHFEKVFNMDEPEANITPAEGC